MTPSRPDAPNLRSESLLQLTWPIFLQNISVSLVVLVDIYFFSQLSDTVAATSGQLSPVFGMGAFVINVFAGSGISVASQFMGAKQHDKVVPTYVANLVLAGSLGLTCTLLMGTLSLRLATWMGMGPELRPIADEYLSTICFYFIFQGVLAAYNAVLSSRGMTHWLMYTSFLVAGINFCLDPLFVWGFGWGVRGITFASVLGVMVAAGVSVYLVHFRLGVSFRLHDAVRRVREVLPLMRRVAVSNSVEPFSYTFQQTLLSTLVIAIGVTAMAANNYASRFHVFHITFGFSLASGTQILAAHWMGAGRITDVNLLFWQTIRASMLVAFVYAVLLWQLAPVALSVFTSDPKILALGSDLLLISLATEPARAVNIVGGFTLRSVGDTRFPMLLGMVFIWGMIPVAFGLDYAGHLSLRGLWMCLAADEIIRAVMNAARWHSGHWQNKAFARPAEPASAEETVTPATA